MKDITTAAWNWLESKLKDATEIARLVILCCVAVIAIMWLFNIEGNQSVNGLFGFVGLILVILLTISSKVIMPSAALTGLIALLGRNNPVRGTLHGPLWVVSIARSFLYGFLFFATFLTFWSFENSPSAFWGIFLLVMMLFIWRERYGSLAGWMKWIEWSYIILCGAVLLWSTFGDVYHGKAFDPETGTALHMVSPSTGEIDSLGRTPAECQGTNSCFSESTGERLVPMTMEQALMRNPSGLAHSAITGVSNIELPDISMGDSGSNCPASNPCVAYDGYVLNLSAGESLVINQEQFWETGLDIKVTDPELRAEIHDSRLFTLQQPDDSNVVTIVPVATGFATAGRDTIEIVIYRGGSGDERVRQDYGVHTPAISLTPAE